MTFLSDIDTRNKNNNLNFIRLVAAIAVAFGHGFILLTGSDQTILGGMAASNFGFISVAIFFGLSGYLVSQSFIYSSSWFSYFKARFLRIFPGLMFANFITVLILTAFFLPEGWSFLLTRRPWDYVVQATFFWGDPLAGLFVNNHVTAVNGSLWTLPTEFRYYLLVMILGVFSALRRPKIILLVLLILLGSYLIPDNFLSQFLFRTVKAGPGNPAYTALPLAFGIGMLFFQFKKWIPIHVGTLGLAVLGWYFFPHSVWYLKIPCAVYSSFVLGFHPRLFLKPLSNMWDLSYGTYVIAFPIQQTMISMKVTDNPWTLFLYTAVFTLTFAAISWKLIEKPALRWKHSIPPLRSWINFKELPFKMMDS
jgi:peptidoglycan/LPS O-acetylase OafA/YrhL